MTPNPAPQPQPLTLPDATEPPGGGASVLLIIGGGIAAYKSLELIRLLAKRGVAARCILTASATHFVTPLSVGALSGQPVHTALLDLDAEAKMGHIELSRSADLVVACPATANLMAKAAAGLADDLATTALLATDKPVLMVPAMNVRMWEHAATQANIASLRERGVEIMEPGTGAMACGETGPGRLPEPDAIAARILERLRPGPRDLAGRHALVTAGPTREPIDPVRYLSNHSSGRQGYAIAAALAERGARVTLVSGPVALDTPPGVERVHVETAREMLAAAEAALPADVFVSVAAVADWRPAQSAQKKLKLKEKAGGAPALALSENPDILATLSALPEGRRPELVIGFAAETHDVAAHAQAKLARKGCDWIVANDVSGDVMGGSRNTVSLFSAAGAENWPDAAKEEVARRLAGRVAGALAGPPADAQAAE